MIAHAGDRHFSQGRNRHQGYRLKGRTPTPAPVDTLGVAAIPDSVPTEEVIEPLPPASRRGFVFWTKLRRGDQSRRPVPEQESLRSRSASRPVAILGVLLPSATCGP